MRKIFLSAALCILATPALADELIGRVQSALEAKDYDKAIALVNQSLVDPKLTNNQIAGLRCERGIAYVMSNRAKDGIDDLTFALESNSGAGNLSADDKQGHAAIYVLRGIGYRSIGNDDAALADFKMATVDDPTSPDAYEMIGNVYYGQGKTDDAIASYGEAISRDPKDADAFVNRGENYENKNLFDQAEADYDAAIAIQPDYAMAYNDRGTVYDRVGKLSQAEADYSKAVSLDATEALYLRNRAALHNKRGEWQAAIDDLNKALMLQNDDKEKQTIDDLMKTARDGLAKKSP